MCVSFAAWELNLLLLPTKCFIDLFGVGESRKLDFLITDNRRMFIQLQRRRLQMIGVYIPGQDCFTIIRTNRSTFFQQCNTTGTCPQRSWWIVANPYLRLGQACIVYLSKTCTEFTECVKELVPEDISNLQYNSNTQT